jgi:glycosyltransferase involved in cell wall biosynthesis
MRVTHVAPTAFGGDGLFGGGERYPLELARALARHVLCRLVTFGHDDRLIHEPSGLELVVLRARRFVGGHPAHPVGDGLVRALSGAHVVHAHHLRSRATTIALWAALVRQQRRVVTDHGLLQRAGVVARLGAGPARLVDRFLTVSRYSAGVLGTPPDRTTVIFGGADPDRFHPERDEQRDGVLFVGRITPHKGVDRLIEALPPGTRLTIAGSEGHDPAWPERGYADLLRRRAASASGQVTFAGTVTEEELPRLMRRHAVLVLPSVERTCFGREVRVSELLGLTVIEAMASGTPVVCSRTGGVAEVVADGATGCLVPPGDVDALRDRLATLLHDRSLRERLGRNAREVALEHFTWDQCARRCLESYEELLAARGDPIAAA